MRERIRAILSKVIIGFDEYTGDDLIKDGMLDSIGLLEIISEIEEEFSVEITAEKMVFENFATIDDIEKLITDIRQEGMDG